MAVRHAATNWQSMSAGGLSALAKRATISCLPNVWALAAARVQR